MLLRSGDHFQNNLRGHQRTHRIMHKHDVAGGCRSGSQRVVHRLLTRLTSNHKFDTLPPQVLRFRFHAGAESGDFVFPQGNADLAHRIHGGKLPQRVNQDWCSAQFGKLLRFCRTLGSPGLSRRPRHASSQSGRRDDHNDFHCLRDLRLGFDHARRRRRRNDARSRGHHWCRIPPARPGPLIPFPEDHFPSGRL